jgi:CHAT domain-containing protein
LKDLGAEVQRLDEQVRAIAPGGLGMAEARTQAEDLARRREAAWAELTEFQLRVTERHGPATGQIFDLARIQARLPADAALVAWLDVTGPRDEADASNDHWACVIRRRGEPAWVRIPGSGAHGQWTREDAGRPARVGATLSREPDAAAGRWREETGALARQRLAPLEPLLDTQADLPAVHRLIVLPSPALRGLPIEALVGLRPDGRPKYLVSYAPSATIFAWLHERRRAGTSTGPGDPTGSPRLLALGDPVFTAPDEASPPAPGSSTGGDDLAALLAPTRGRIPDPLPGTRSEVLEIAGLFDRPETLLGSEASEQRLGELARTGRLREFGFLHLATHGQLDGRDALRSSLLLARDRLPDPLKQVLAGGEVYDGELSAEQILRTWSLDAELVTLSACQTALGRPGGGEGYLGFSQVLFLAGARSVVLSLWSVDDRATALLMKRFYQNLLGRRAGLDHPLPKAEALADAKHWLRGLNVDEATRLGAGLPAAKRLAKVSGPPRPAAGSIRPYEHPYYWAAFILIGDPN